MFLSIIIVNYKVKEELFSCIDSIKKSKTKKSYEIIIVDNDEKKTIGRELFKKFPDVIYFPSKKNLGFGGGNNLGAKAARGEFFYFLNPDTEVSAGSIDTLIDVFSNKKKCAIVAPVLTNENDEVIPLQGAKTLTPLRAIFSFSALSLLLPNNKTKKQFWIADWDRKKIREVDTVPGTAFLIKKNIFEQIGGFDEKFFLYFEEYDLCKRVKDLGYDIFIEPKSRVLHKMGRSTGKSEKKNINKIFEKSRFYYFRKNYGLFKAVLTSLAFSLNKKNMLLWFILAFSAFLRFYKLGNLMPFLGDYAWFYLSARDLILKGDIPLVGIASSHPWLHQGPLWTYLLSIALWLGKFDPVWGAYLAAIIGTLTVYCVYKFCSDLFSERIAFVAAVLYATSPLVVFNSRVAYHTSPIPLLSILFVYSLVRWVKGNYKFFPFVIFFLSLLYNLEIASVLLLVPLAFVLALGFYKKKEWAINAFSPKILFFSFSLFLFAMLPVIIYDINNGFPQTLKFAEWMGYRVLVVLGIVKRSILEKGTIFSASTFLLDNFKKLFFIHSLSLSLFFLFFTFIFSLFYLLFKKTKTNITFIVVFLITLFLSTTFIFNKVSSDAYLPVMFPLILIIFAFCLSYLPKIILFPILILIFLGNVNFLFTSNFFTKKSANYYSEPIDLKVQTSQKILKLAEGHKYNILMKGINSEFESTAMTYQYLTWYLGNEAVTDPQTIKILIDETDNGAVVKKLVR